MHEKISTATPEETSSSVSQEILDGVSVASEVLHIPTIEKASNEQKYLFSTIEKEPEESSRFPIYTFEEGAFTVLGFEKGGKRYPYKQEMADKINIAVLKRYLEDVKSNAELEARLEAGAFILSTILQDDLKNELKKTDNQTHLEHVQRNNQEINELMADNRGIKKRMLLETNQRLLDYYGLKAEDFENDTILELRRKLIEFDREKSVNSIIDNNKSLVSVLGLDSVEDLMQRKSNDVKWMMERLSRAMEANYYLEANEKILSKLGIDVQSLKNEDDILNGIKSKITLENHYNGSKINKEADDADDKMKRKKDFSVIIDTALSPDTEEKYKSIKDLLGKSTVETIEKRIESKKQELQIQEEKLKTLKEKSEIEKQKERILQIKANIKQIIKVQVRKDLNENYRKLFLERTKNVSKDNIRDDGNGARFAVIPGSDSIYSAIPAENLYKDRIKELDDDKKTTITKRSEDELEDAIYESFVKLSKEITKDVIPAELQPVNEVYFFTTGFVVKTEDGHFRRCLGSPLDDRIMSAFPNDQLRKRWCMYWEKMKEKETRIAINCLENTAKEKVKELNDGAGDSVNELFKQYLLETPDILDRRGQLLPAIQPEDVKTLENVLPFIGAFVNGVDLSEVTREITLKSTRLNIMDYLSGEIKDSRSILLCTYDKKIRIKSFERLINNTEPSKNKKIMARLTTAIAAVLFESLNKEQHQTFSALVGDKANVSVADFNTVYQRTIYDNKYRRSIAERTFFLKEFNKYINGKSEPGMKAFFDSLRKYSAIG